MRLGWDRKTGVNRFLRWWKSGMDPGSGSYTFKMNMDGFPEVFLLAGVKPVYWSGPWNGRRFRSTSRTGVHSVLGKGSRGSSHRKRGTNIGTLHVTSAMSTRKCGPWAVCDANALPFCKCMKGFWPKNQQAWDLQDGSDGCVRSSKMDCGTDRFQLMENMKLLEGSKAFVDQTSSLSECGEICKRDYSCAAYVNTNISENVSGCVIWAVDLLDVRRYVVTAFVSSLYSIWPYNLIRPVYTF
ncbi:putative non-specific serine/threonine protein kinase [Helianthus annuus]|nr:putative non-specific serine/threonine protein kinase [Helianthus annuus]